MQSLISDFIRLTVTLFIHAAAIISQNIRIAFIFLHANLQIRAEQFSSICIPEVSLCQ